MGDAIASAFRHLSTSYRKRASARDNTSRMSSTSIPRVVPARLSFLAIYNPELGKSDETFHNQIVFYYSSAAKARAKLHESDTQAAQELKEQENEKLRQVGLAQGMVGFARYVRGRMRGLHGGRG